MALTQQEKGERFRALHEGEAFIIPNPWDAGSAKVFAALGFQALATTSSGFAFTLGRPDGAPRSTRSCAHVAVLDAATDLPVSADLENGYGPEPSDAARRDPPRRRGGRGRRLDRGLRPRGRPLRPRARGRARRGRRRGRPRRSTSPSRSPRGPRTTSAATPTSTTRSPACRPTRRPAPTSSTRPGSSDGDEIRAVCDAVGKPVNVLAHKGLSVAEIADAGGSADQRRRRAHVGRGQRDGGGGAADPRRGRLLGARPGAGEIPAWLRS